MRKDGKERRDAILDAALSCFVERGILGAGIEEIRCRAGASASSVYHLFDDRSGIVVALLERTFERLFAHLAARVTRTRTARRAVVALVEAHLDWVLDRRDEARFMYQATAMELSPSSSGALQARKAELLAPIVCHIERFIDEGSLPRWSPLVFDVVVLGPSHEACRRYLAGAPLDPAWMKSALPRIAWRSVRPIEITPRAG